MTAAEFRAWYDRRGYERNTQAVADLCAPWPTLSHIRNDGRDMPPDIDRLCRMVDLLYEVAGTDPAGPGDDGDRRLVAEARGLLAVYAPPRPGRLPDSRWGWQYARDARMCRVAAAVSAVARECRDPALADVQAAAADMVREWDREGRLG